MVKDRSDSKWGNPLLPLHGLLFSISRNGYFRYTIQTDRIAHYRGRCYTSCGALTETSHSSMGPLWAIDSTTHHPISEHSYHGAISRSHSYHGAISRSHHERTLLPRSYISLQPWANTLTTELYLAPTMSEHSYHGAISRSHHERTLLPRSYISLPPWANTLTTELYLAPTMSRHSTMELHLTPILHLNAQSKFNMTDIQISITLVTSIFGSRHLCW